MDVKYLAKVNVENLGNSLKFSGHNNNNVTSIGELDTPESRTLQKQKNIYNYTVDYKFSICNT